MDHEDHVRIADFGLSLIGDETRGRLETTGSGSGSPGWMAPEAYEHETARRRSPADVYAFGLLCYMVSSNTFLRLPLFIDFRSLSLALRRSEACLALPTSTVW
jgi:serine/threonine protein kinase